MQVRLSILRVIVFALLIAAIGRPITGCSKNSGPGRNDSTDTVLHHQRHDSAKFYVSFTLDIVNSSGVFQDTVSDGGDLIIYVVDGVVTIPHDSIVNVPPFAIPESGSSGAWSATWVEDNIGEINIVGGSGVLVGDTTVIISLDHSGTVSPKWSVSFNGTAPFFSGGDPTPGWPPIFSFSLIQQSQYPIEIRGQGDVFEVWVYKDY